MHEDFGPDSEIAWCADQSLAEMVQPNAICINAGRERIIRVGDGASQFQASAAIRKGRTIRAA